MSLRFLQTGVLCLAMGSSSLPAQPPPPYPQPGVRQQQVPPLQYRPQPGLPRQSMPGYPNAAPQQMPFHLYQQPVYLPPARPMRIQDYSWTYVSPGPPRVLKVQDIITVLVDEKSQVVIQSRFDRQRTGTFQAQLNEFIRIGEDGTLDNAADNAPSVDGNLQNRLRTTGQVYDQEGITYRIAATIVDILPNGNVVLEARKNIYSNGDYWEYTLTGVMRSQDISSNNTALSENIANLKIVKKMKGKVHDSTKRPWGTKLLDMLFPF